MLMVAYTDGSCQPNPGKGGWGWCHFEEGSPIIFTDSGGTANSTNNRMEITAIIELLGSLRDLKIKTLRIYSDSKNTLKTLVEGDFSEGVEVKNRLGRPMYTGYLKNWNLQKGTKKSGLPFKNHKLWLKFDKELRWWAKNQSTKIILHWIKGHSGDFGNDLADELAQNAVPKL